LSNKTDLIEKVPDIENIFPSLENKLLYNPIKCKIMLSS